MRAVRAITWIAVALGASAVSCAGSPVERSSVTADVSSAESAGTETPAQGPGLDAGSPIPPPVDPIDLDAGVGPAGDAGPIGPIEVDAGDWPMPM